MRLRANGATDPEVPRLGEQTCILCARGTAVKALAELAGAISWMVWGMGHGTCHGPKMLP